MTDSANQSNELILLAQSGDVKAMSTIVENNIALVKYVIKRFIPSGKDWEDMYQLGCLGLVKAVRNFDTSIGVRFSTYAVPVILGEVRRFLRDDGLIRVSRSIRDNARTIWRYREKVASETGKSPTLDDIAANCDMPREDVVIAYDSLKPALSLSTPLSSDGSLTLGDTIGGNDMAEVDRRIWVSQLLSALGDEEREVIVRRFYKRQTQTQIAKALGMTQVQISRMEARLLKRLKEIAQAG